MLRDGPWRFNEHILALKEVVDIEAIDRSVLKRIPFWVQVYGVPLLRMNETTARNVGGILGPVLEVDMDRGLGFLRVRVEIHVTVPIPRGFSIISGGRDVMLDLKYERLPNFCYWCGMLNHVEDDCERTFAQVDSDSRERNYGDWLRGYPPKRSPWHAERGKSFSGFRGNYGSGPAASVTKLSPFSVASVQSRCANLFSALPGFSMPYPMNPPCCRVSRFRTPRFWQYLSRAVLH